MASRPSSVSAAFSWRMFREKRLFHLRVSSTYEWSIFLLVMFSYFKFCPLTFGEQEQPPLEAISGRSCSAVTFKGRCIQAGQTGWTLMETISTPARGWFSTGYKRHAYYNTCPCTPTEYILSTIRLTYMEYYL
eukprot:XP_025008222.1 uncharacterized protein LOC112532789 isoform X1 [Gallus gallus]